LHNCCVGDLTGLPPARHDGGAGPGEAHQAGRGVAGRGAGGAAARAGAPGRRGGGNGVGQQTCEVSETSQVCRRRVTAEGLVRVRPTKRGGEWLAGARGERLLERARQAGVAVEME